MLTPEGSSETHTKPATADASTQLAIEQHIGSTIKSLSKLADTSGIDKQEFKSILKGSLEDEEDLENEVNAEKENAIGNEENEGLPEENEGLPEKEGSEDELEDEDADDSDIESECSTAVYEHEPFEVFQHKVRDFALSFWNGCNGDDITVSRMAGGGYNRIIGITVRASDHKKEVDYILRIPRYDTTQLGRDVAALRYVRGFGDIPVPDVIAFDETSGNKLGNPYMVQNRLAGASLLSLYPDLDQAQKCRVASELGHFFNHNANGTGDKTDHVSIEPLFQPGVSVNDQLQPNLTTRDLLFRVFEERKAESLRRFPGETLEPMVLDRFIAMTNGLHQDGWFASNDISVCHLDLEPRNILIDTTGTNVQPLISGVLDWDSAVLAPSFMSCAPPFWIWAWDDEEEDERTANDVPPTEEGRELKNLFEEAAGADFVRYAYPSAYRLARRLVRFAIDGMNSNEHIKEANTMLEEWDKVRDMSK
ncbi:hypothetical protein E8E13_008944 [Curvularia kusanoi]|uniref:Aminoglycoside phosphotransferase domain-containing protein n=1 Tax=Curvularia kusanoi TaxID=90978 RepID=A0A9P4WE33_CURKU|nr:hypothetical protein E8E13_008944 [Curvularia kusanoi]